MLQIMKSSSMEAAQSWPGKTETLQMPPNVGRRFSVKARKPS
jgi:hypothetical protein